MLAKLLAASGGGALVSGLGVGYSLCLGDPWASRLARALARRLEPGEREHEEPVSGPS